VRLPADEAWSLLRASDHGVLATVHAERGVDAVPVVFAVHGERILVPVDTVKAKSTTRLQRLVNLAHDPRCVLLVDHYDDDWTQLWWVRADGDARIVEAPTPEATAAAALLATRYPQYRAQPPPGPVIAIAVDRWSGWAASG
jgi:PPOX class probable F420-dependent enzyme